MNGVATDPETGAARIDPATRIGAVRLTVRDADAAGEFYERAIGLRRMEGDGDTVRLGADGEVLIELHGDPDAPAPPPRATGLFHLAILVPSRRELADALRRVAGSGWPLAGASDHLVSEALYLSDPDGNGIEIYRDRPADEWHDEDGSLRMATLPLDLRELADEAGGEGSEPDGMPVGTRVGHVHLRVADLDPAERFYAGELGFDVTTRDYPGALFVSAGDYHHHVGLNTWAGPGAAPPPPGAIGLRSFEVVLPDHAQLDVAALRLEASGGEIERCDAGVLVRDPSRNGVLLVAG
ncbi:MAG: VOC family protein [Solirubrobacterales bacterium]